MVRWGEADRRLQQGRWRNAFGVPVRELKGLMNTWQERNLFSVSKEEPCYDDFFFFSISYFLSPVFSWPRSCINLRGGKRNVSGDRGYKVVNYNKEGGSIPNMGMKLGQGIVTGGFYLSGLWPRIASLWAVVSLTSWVLGSLCTVDLAS